MGYLNGLSADLRSIRTNFRVAYEGTVKQSRMLHLQRSPFIQKGMLNKLKTDTFKKKKRKERATAQKTG